MIKRLFLLCIAVLTAALPAVAGDKQRGLWACKTEDGKKVFVSWRMRQGDDPRSTTYRLYADGRLIETLTERTNLTLDAAYSSSIFSVEVLNAAGEVVDRQDGVGCKDAFFHHIALSYPGDYTMPDGTVVTYTPNDCSAYDMDGDGEQEIIMKWEPSNSGADCKATSPQVIDCYKLDGTQLWRINLGPNVIAGCRVTFLCYDFDGDGRGELITKTAQGTRDSSGEYLSKGAAQGADHSKSSVNGSGVITNGGKEWITCFDGVTGRELATIDYWPLFNTHSNWDDRSGKTDGATYGHRGNWFKGCVAFLNVGGKPTPCAVTLRGIYTYSYAAAYTWDGTSLSQLWKHTSDKKGQGIYAQGAHSLTVGDMDGDGFDEIMVGAATLDHDGTLLWSSGLGHGDATHLGDFDLDNKGMEVFIITEEGTAKYDAAMLDAKTGKVLFGKPQTGGDTARGMAIDCDGTYPGAEVMEWGDENLMTCKGENIAPWHVGSTKSSSINYRIYWDGDLLDEYHDRSHVDKWNASTHSWDRLCTLYNYAYGASTINSTKYNPNLQCDLFGDWREEAVYWAQNGGQFYLTVFTSTIESQYKLPWLRDDHVYDMAIAWQNCGYNQTPHLGYSPVDYHRRLAAGEDVGIKDASLNSKQQISNSTSSRYFNLQGQRIDGTPHAPGLYIMNGKKVVKHAKP